jgi:hypothetical protein
MSYHCIIHQEALCAKARPFEHVMNVVTKIVNSIRAAPLQHRIFKALLEDVEDKPTDLLLHTEVRWLSRGKVLSRFLALIEAIKDFLKSKSDKFKDFDKLNDRSWLLDLAFLADITEKLNSLNLDLQGKDKDVAHMISSINSFKAKLTLWMSQIKSKSLVHFPNMKKMIGESNFASTSFARHLQTLLQQFETRFLKIFSFLNQW